MSSKKKTDSNSIDSSEESTASEVDQSSDARAEENSEEMSREEMLQALLEDDDVDEELLAELLAEESDEQQESQSDSDNTPTFPLSYAQQRLWFIDKFESGSSLYNLPLAVEIEGNLDLDALEKAFQQIVERHEMLRTVFLEVDGEPVQQVRTLAALEWVCAHESLQLTPEDRDRVISFKVKKEALTPFKLSEELPIRVKIFAISTPGTSKNSHVVVVTLHHIAADGWSFNNLFSELLQGYRHFAFNADQQLPKLDIQYGDYADWQREHYGDEKLQAEMDYWVEQLQAVPVLELPTQAPRPAELSLAGDALAWEFDKSLLAAVKAKARKAETSVFNVLLAAFSVLVSRYSRQRDFAVGIPVAGRNDKNLESLIGFFINSLAIRIRISDDLTVDQLIEQVKQTTAKAYGYQTVPFEQIVAHLDLDRSGSNTPLYQVMFSLQNAPEATDLLASDIGIGDLKFRALNADSDVAKYDLVCNLRETPRGFIGGFSYRSELFEADWITALQENFALVLDQVSTEGELRVSDIEVASKKQIADIQGMLTGDRLSLPLASSYLVEENTGRSSATNADVQERLEDKDFIQRFIAIAEKTPSQVALLVGDEQYSYGRLNDASNRLAVWLQQQGVSRQSLVPVICERGFCQLVCYLGVLKLGAAYVAVDPKQPAERQQFIISDTQASQCLVQSGLDPQISELSVTKEINEDFFAELKPVADDFQASFIESNDLVYTIYTSGSTGQPKGVLIERHGLENLIAWHQQAYEVNEHSKATVLAGEGFDASVWEIWPYLSAGASLTVIGDEERLQVDGLANFIQLNGITHSFMPTPLAEAFLQMADLHGECSLQFLLTGGDALTVWPNEQLPFRLFNHYGPTEASVVATAGEVLSGSNSKSVPAIGRAISNIRLHILDDQLHPVPRGVFGELCIEGVSLARGYLNRAEEEEKSFVEVVFEDQPRRLYRTGDLVSLAADGQIHFHGRIDQQVKIRGYRIELGEIMAQLNALTLVSESVVIVDTADSDQDRLLAYCVLAPGLAVESDTVLSRTVRQQLEGKLPSYMLPDLVLQIPTIPLTVNGKIDRAQLPAVDSILAADVANLAPLVGTRQEELADLWCEVLSLNPEQIVSSEQNFFELGGHSLSAAKLMTAIEQRYDVSLSLKSFFQEATIAQLEQMIAAAPAAVHGRAEIIPAGEGQSDYPLSFVQQRLWYVLELNPSSTAYNMPLSLELKGRINLAALKQAVLELVQRHHILRSTIVINSEGEPRLKILDQVPENTVQVELCSDLDAKHWQQKTRARTKQSRLHLFDWQNEPLFFCDLLYLERAEQSELVMNLVFHHLISDGWSIAVFFRELAQLYQAFDHQDNNPLAPLEIQYQDYANWQRQSVELPEIQEKVVSFWVDQLKDAHRVLELTPDKPRQQALLHIADHVYFELNEVESAQFQQLCQKLQLTPFMLLLAAYQLTLSKHTGQKDVCVGIPLSGRDNPQLHPLIGYFINGLVVRSQFEDNPSVENFLLQVKATVLEVFENQNVPTQLLFERLQLVRAGGELPGQRNTFAFQNFADRNELQTIENLSTPDLEIQLKGATELQAKQDLALVCYEQDGRIKGSLEFDTDLFHRETIEQFCGHLRWILNQCIADTEAPVTSLSVISQQDLLALLDHEQRYEQILPLTAIQRDILLSGLVEVESHKNNLGFAGIINVPLDFDRVKEAVDTVVAQQALLRGEFIESRHNYLDDAYFAIRKNVDYTVHLQDLRDKELSEEDCQAIAERRIFYPYQLLGEEKTELLRFDFFQLADDKYLFVISDHHSLLDGVGNFLMAGYFISTYLALITGGQAPAVIDNFADYVAFDRKHTDRSETIQFWREQSQGVEPLTFPRGNLRQINAITNTGESSLGRKVSKQCVIDDAEVQAIKLYCKSARITPALYFKALYAFVLQAYCNAESDFFLSELVAGRPKGHQASLGCYYQQLPAIFKIADFYNDKDVLDLFKSVRAFQKKIKPYHNISIFAQRRELVHGPVSFMYNYNPFLEEVSFMGEAHKNLGFVPDVEDQVQLHLKNVGEGLHLNLYYYDNQFEDFDLLQRLVAVNRQLLAGATKIGELSLLLPMEQAGDGSNAELDGSRLQGESVDSFDSPAENVDTVALWLEQSYESFKHKQAIQLLADDGSIKNSLTYAQLYERVKTTSALLHNQGVNSGDRVALVLNRSLELMITLLSLIRLGAVYIPIDPQYPKERVQFIAQDSAAKWIVMEESAVEELPTGAGPKSLSVEALVGVAGSTVAVKPHHAQPDDEFYLIYTSGTTGRPKGSIVLQKGVQNLQQWYIDEMEFNDSDRHLVISAIGFDLTQKNLFAPLLSGGTILFPSSSLYDASQLLQQIAQQKITRINCAPSAIYPIIDTATGGESLSSLKTLVLGGEVIQASLLDGLPNQTQVYNSYGPTECTDISAFHKLSAKELAGDAEILLGRPNAGVNLEVRSVSGQLLPKQMLGELWVEGVSVGKGYWQQAEQTAEKFITDGERRYYKTGDLVRLTPTAGEDQLQYIGRKDFQIKWRGFRIELAEIELSLIEVKQIKQALVMLKESEGRERLVAYVLTDEAIDEQEVRHSLRAFLADYMIPDLIISVARWPLTANGKIDRSALPSPESLLKEKHVKQPRNATEQVVWEIWREVLGVETFGVDESFFDLGGHSLLANQINARIRKKFQLELSLRDFIETPSVAGVAAAISRLQQQGGQQLRPALVARAGEENSLPLSFQQERLWYLQQLVPQSNAYHMPLAMLVTGELDISALGKAFLQLIAKHESLRTNFVDELGVPQQRVWDMDEIPWLADTEQARGEVIETSDLSVTEISAVSIREHSEVRDFFQSPFDLAAGPLIKFRVFQLKGVPSNSGQWLLLANMHHIVADGWSLNILLRDLLMAYAAGRKNTELELPPLAINYGDFSLWQRQYLQGDVLQQKVNFWVDYLRHAPTRINVYPDRIKPAAPTDPGGFLAFEFTSELSVQLQDIGAAHNHTLFTVLLGCYQLFLAKYSGNYDITLAAPNAGRDLLELEGIIGFFVNAVLIRSRVDPEQGLISHLDTLKDNVSQVFSHQDAPVHLVMEALNLAEREGAALGAQLGFSLQTTQNNQAGLDGFSAETAAAWMSQFGLENIEPIALQDQSAKTELGLAMSEQQGVLRGAFEYNKALFDESTVQTIADLFQAFVAQLVSESQPNLTRVQLYSPQQLGQRVGAEKVLALTAMQRDMLLENLVNPNSLQSSHGFAVQLNQAVDVDLFRRTVDWVVNQTPAMTLKFLPGFGRGSELYYQTFVPRTEIPFEFRDWAEHAGADWNIYTEEVAEAVNSFVYRPYDVLRDELSSYLIIKLAEERYVCVCACHHALVDGMGLSAHSQHLAMNYLSLANGNDLMPVASNFENYIANNAAIMDQPETLAFWREAFSAVEPLELGAQVHTPTRVEKKTQTLTLDQAKVLEIKAFCKKQRITPALYFKCLYALLIRAYTRAQSDFIVYEALNGRSKTESFDVGCFIQQLPMVFSADSISSANSFQEFFASARSFQRSTKRFQNFSAGVQNKLAPMGRVGFNYNYYHFIETIEFLGEKHLNQGLPSELRNQVQLLVKDVGNELCLDLVYYSDVFNDDSFVQRLISCNEQILGGLERLSELSLFIDDDEKGFVRRATHGESQAFDETLGLHHYFENSVLSNADGIAVVDDSGSLSYNELNARANQIALHLLSSHANAPVVAVYCQRSNLMLAAILGVLKAGKAYLPIDANYPQERVAYMLEHSGVSGVLTEQDLVQRIGESENIEVLALDRWLNQEEGVTTEVANPNLPFDLSQPAYLLYTSGSTGQPKGVLVPHRGAVNHILAEFVDLQVFGHFNFLQSAPASSDISVWQFLAPLFTGGTVVILDDVANAEKCFDLIKRYDVHLAELVPVALTNFLDYTAQLEAAELPYLRHMMATGERVPVDLVNRWLTHYPTIPIVNAYGPTEASDDVAQITLRESLAPRYTQVPIGKPLNNIVVEVVDDQFNPLPPGIPGELLVSGVAVADGYWQDKEKTHQAFVDVKRSVKTARAYRTGDLGVLSNAGDLYCLGRVDQQIKLRGYRIELEEIEAVFSGLDQVSAVTVVLKEDEHRGSYLAAYLIPDDGLTGDRAAFTARVKEQASTRLPVFMMPSFIAAMDAFPLTPAGKIDRKRLPDAVELLPERVYLPPLTATEIHLADIWRQLFGVDKISRDDNFFELGGHSILAVRLFAMIEQSIGIKLSVSLLFQYQVLEQLATVIDLYAQREKEWSALRELHVDDSKPLLLFMHPLNGQLVSYHPLAKLLSDRFSLYGLEARGLTQGELYSTLSEMVLEYVEALDDAGLLSSARPISLLGQSLGGLLALALAEALKERGMKVEHIYLLDTFLPEHILDPEDESALIDRIPEQLLPVPKAQLKAMPTDERMALLLNLAKQSGLVADEFSFELLEKQLGMAKNNVLLARQVAVAQILESYDGQLIHIAAEQRAEELESEAGWSELCPQAVFTSTPGNHESLLQSPQVEALHTKLLELMRDFSAS